MEPENQDKTPPTDAPPAPPAAPPATPPTTDNGLAAQLRIAEKAKKDAEAKAAAAEAKLAEIERAKLSEQERLAQDLAALKPKAEQAQVYEQTIGEILEIELNDVPEDKRGLVPELAPHAKLKWLREAKSKGLFGTTAPPPPPKPGAANAPPPPPANGGGAGSDAALIERINKAKSPHEMQQILKENGRLKRR
jgi:hypothetical protein